MVAGAMAAGKGRALGCEFEGSLRSTVVRALVEARQVTFQRFVKGAVCKLAGVRDFIVGGFDNFDGMTTKGICLCGNQRRAEAASGCNSGFPRSLPSIPFRSWPHALPGPEAARARNFSRWPEVCHLRARKPMAVCAVRSRSRLRRDVWCQLSLHRAMQSKRTIQAGSFRRAVHIALKAGRDWQFSNQAFTAGNSVNRVGWPWA